MNEQLLMQALRHPFFDSTENAKGRERLNSSAVVVRCAWRASARRETLGDVTPMPEGRGSTPSTAVRNARWRRVPRLALRRCRCARNRRR
jgi:hypothetical protein